MANVSITPGSVLKTSTTVLEQGIAGATILAGQWVYRDATDSNHYKLADTDSGTEAVRLPRGMALNGASDGQPLQIARSGSVTLGGTVTKAVVYYLSGDAGAICPIGDVAAGDYTCVLGIATTAALFDIKIVGGGIVLA